MKEVSDALDSMDMAHVQSGAHPHRCRRCSTIQTMVDTMRRGRNKLKGLRPKGGGWKRLGNAHNKGKQRTATVIWQCGPIRVLADTSIYRSEVDGSLNPQHHLSVTTVNPFTLRPERVSDVQFQEVIDAFVPDGAWWEEDNHHPGNARHIFIPLYASHQQKCPCKDEEIVVEEDGYTYSYDGSYDKEQMANILGRPQQGDGDD